MSPVAVQASFSLYRRWCDNQFPLCSRCILQVRPDLPRGRVYPQVQPCATRSLNQCRRKEGAHLVVLANA